MTGIRATDIEKTDEAIKVTLENGAVLESIQIEVRHSAGRMQHLY
jgi:alkyl hydroperoxide reductase subunit F